MTYYAASIGPRFGDASATYVVLDRGPIAGYPAILRKLDEVAYAAAKYEQAECNDAFGAGEAPDIVVWGPTPMLASDLFTGQELKEVRRRLMQGFVVSIYR